MADQGGGTHCRPALAGRGLRACHLNDDAWNASLLRADKLENYNEIVQTLFSDPAIKKAAHGIKNLCRTLLAEGITPAGFVFDTEVYSNTGGQASKSSNIGQVAQFAAAGKAISKKSLAEIVMQYGYVYVAQVAMGANPAQTLKAIQEAEAYPGPSLIIAYSPCEMHSIKGGMMNCQAEMKKAVECGYWNLFRFNPDLKKDGKNPFTLDSKAPAGGYQEFLLNEARYSSLTRSFPDRAKELFALNEETAKKRYDKLLRLQKMYEA